MQVSQTYGVTRPQEIANRLASLRARFASVQPEVAPTAPAFIESPEIEAQDAQRLPFVQLFPHLRESHLKAQRRMFAAIKTADLSMEISARMRGTNALLGTSLETSRALSPDEMHTVADAVESGLFSSDWELVSLPLSDADAPPETEELPEVGTPAALESLDEIAMEFDLAQMRAADRARALSAIYAEKIQLETRLSELEHAILCA